MRTFKQHYNELTRKKKYAAMETIFGNLSLIFVKITPSKVNGYEMSWRLQSEPVVSLYKNHLKLHYWPFQSNRVVRRHLSSIAKFSLNCIQDHDLVTFSDGSKSVFFKGMKISYRGKPVLPYPRKYVEKTEMVLQEMRERKNALQRLYYHRKKAADRFEAAAVFEDDNKRWRTPKYVDVSKLPMDDVFKLQNVSHRKYIIDYYGMDTILAGLESTVIDSDVINGNAYELLEVIIPFSNGEDGEGDQIGTYLRMVNPSTDEIHFEGVPNYNKYFASDSDRQWARDNTILSPTVRAALAWRDNETRYTIPIKLT
jgi:hypothetical protein